jgi:neutral trehalase
MLWIDAICQQALSASIISEMYEIVGDAARAAEWNAKYQAKKDIVNSLYWDEEDKFYYDIDRNTHALYRIMTTASYWALTA